MHRSFQDQDKPFIVYVDDDPDDLDLVGHTIKSINPSLDVHGYLNGRKAVEFLESIPDRNRLPSIVILDLNMPDWNGLKTMEVIKSNSVYQHIPVFIFTNSDYPLHRELALTGGAAGFITKPYNLADMKKICAEFVEYCNHPVQLKNS